VADRNGRRTPRKSRRQEDLIGSSGSASQARASDVQPRARDPGNGSFHESAIQGHVCEGPRGSRRTDRETVSYNTGRKPGHPLRSEVYRAIACIAALMWVNPLQAYSVLTHEAIIDTV